MAVPAFLYGTAWKENETERLTTLALQSGFRGIDTANQRRHYHEVAVGKAISAAIRNGLVTRDELFVQTKFTFLDGQDHRLPYDPKASIAVQVEQSFASSIEHLGISVLDSYVLHGPCSRIGLTPTDWEAWRAMEAICERKRVRMLGISNVGLDQLVSLCQGAQVMPRFVQNRCYASSGWDREVRAFCAANGVIYQGFSLLTANRAAMNHPVLIQIAKQHNRTAAQIIFRFALDIGMMPLTGTNDPAHMQTDLEVFDFRLEANEVASLDVLVER